MLPLKIHVRKVQRDIKTKNVTEIYNNLGYYMQGDDNTERNYNVTAQEKIHTITRKSCFWKYAWFWANDWQREAFMRLSMRLWNLRIWGKYHVLYFIYILARYRHHCSFVIVDDPHPPPTLWFITQLRFLKTGNFDIRGVPSHFYLQWFPSQPHVFDEITTYPRS